MKTILFLLHLISAI